MIPLLRRCDLRRPSFTSGSPGIRGTIYWSHKRDIFYPEGRKEKWVEKETETKSLVKTTVTKDLRVECVRYSSEGEWETVQRQEVIRGRVDNKSVWILKLLRWL